MTTLRSIRPLAAGALLLTAGTAVVFGLAYRDRLAAPAPAPTPTAAYDAAHTATASRQMPIERADGLKREAPRGLALRLDDAMDVAPAAPITPAPSQPAADIGRHGIDAEAAGDFVENETDTPGLDLSVPAAEEPATLAAADTAAPNDGAAAREIQASKLALSSPADNDFQPKVETFNIFNPEYGLRGFMKQNWINQRVAFQGGFGLDDDRIEKTSNDGFRDNIAVGMGLILAF